MIFPEWAYEVELPSEYEVIVKDEKIADPLAMLDYSRYGDQKSLRKHMETTVRQALRKAAAQISSADMRSNPNKFGAALKEAMSEVELPPGVTYSTTLKNVTIGRTGNGKE